MEAQLQSAAESSHDPNCVCKYCLVAKYKDRPIDCDHLREIDDFELETIFSIDRDLDEKLLR